MKDKIIDTVTEAKCMDESVFSPKILSAKIGMEK
jgi:hypothetical protein